MSMFMFCAAPEMADPIAKTTMNARSTGFLPNAEARLPMKGRTAVDAIVYALPAQTKSVPWSSPTIVGNAVEIADYGEVRRVPHKASSFIGRAGGLLTRSRAESISTTRLETYTIQKLNPRLNSAGGESLCSFNE